MFIKYGYLVRSNAGGQGELMGGKVGEVIREESQVHVQQNKKQF